MPQIFDNIQLPLVDGLRTVLPEAEACAFCVGYLNLRGWGQLADIVAHLPGGEESRACRLLVGMHRAPDDEMKALLVRLDEVTADLRRVATAARGHDIVHQRKAARALVHSSNAVEQAETKLKRAVEG